MHVSDIIVINHTFICFTLYSSCMPINKHIYSVNKTYQDLFSQQIAYWHILLLIFPHIIKDFGVFPILYIHIYTFMLLLLLIFAQSIKI